MFGVVGLELVVMGDLQPWVPHRNGFLADYDPPPSPPPLPQPSNPDPSEIREESWQAAERATEGVIEEIQATVVSERRRQEVVEFVQRLIGYHLNCEVQVQCRFQLLLLSNLLNLLVGTAFFLVSIGNSVSL